MRSLQSTVLIDAIDNSMQYINGRAQFATAILWCAAASEIALSLLEVLQITDAGYGSASEVAVAVTGLTSLVYLLVFILGAIAFLTWVYRAHDNLAAIGLANLEYTPGKAVGFYFIPFLNLAHGFRVMKEASRGSRWASGKSEQDSWTLVDPDPRIGTWWGCWIGSNVLAWIATRVGDDGYYSTPTGAGVAISVVSNLLGLVAALVLIKVIRRITEDQEKALLRDGELPGVA